MVRNQRDSDGNLIGQVLIPKTGFTTNQYLTGLTWGTLNVENIFSFDTATLPRCFAKYQLWMTNLIIPNTISSLADNSLRYCDLLNSCTFTYFDGDHGVTGWRLAYGDYNYNTTIYVPSEAISWYESQSDYEGCTILPIQ
jgi:hypothetical protein